MALVDRTAYPRLPRSVAARELAEVFTPTGEEVSWARAKTTTDQHCLTLLVLLKCYQRLGYFLRPEQIPAEIAEHVRGCAELTSAGSIIDDDSPRLAKRYREFIREWAGVVWEPPRVRAVAESAMREALLGKDNPADVINVALEQLAQQRCELPAYSTLDRLAAKIRTEVNGGFHRLVAARLDAGARARMLELLIVDPRSRRSRLAELTQPAPKATVTRLKKHLAFLRWLDELGATQEWLAGVPPAKIAHFAGEAAVADAGELGDVGVEKRLTLLACLVHTARIRARDEVVSMFCKRMAVITKRAREHLEELREQHRAESERLLGVFSDVLAGVREALGPSDAEVSGDDGVGADAASIGADPIGLVCERTGRMVLKTLADAGGVDELASTHEAISAHHGNNYAPLMERYYRSHRPVLFELLDAIELEATSTDHSVLNAVEFMVANRHRVGEYIPDHQDGQPVDLSFAGEMWQRTLRDRHRPNRLRRRHFEVCVFAHLAAELRTGDIAVAGSESYANLHTQLMSWAECEPLVPGYCAQAGLPATAAERVARWREELETVATSVDAGYPDNAGLVLEAGRPVIKRRTGAERRASALALEAAIHERLPVRVRRVRAPDR